MTIKESIIRENIANHLELLDKNLKLVAQEHHIKMPDGKKAFIDILAKDDFGCFTVIELKKSNQTARSTIQQLLKYANFLKRKNRLEESQIRCLILSTVWDELKDPLSEFIEFSPYDSKGYLVEYQAEKPPIFTEVKTEYKQGNMSPLNNFIFFEFTTEDERNKSLKDFELTLNSLPSINSVLIKMNYRGDNRKIIHPFGFAWIMFTGDVENMDLDFSKLSPKNKIKGLFDPEDIIYMWEDNTPEYSLRTKVLLDQVRINAYTGEYTGLALHSLNNTLSTWDYSSPQGFGVMFNDGLFDEDEIFSLSCGFFGDHPYNFIAKTSPQRSEHFQMAIKKLDKFLLFNERWRIAVNHNLQEADYSDNVIIYIFNPLNFFGIINDVYKTNTSSRIPSLKITLKKESGETLHYYDSLFWVNEKPIECPKKLVLKFFNSFNEFKLRYFTNGYKNHETSLSEKYGLNYEILCSSGQIIAIDGQICHFVNCENINNLQNFLTANDGFIDQVGALFDEFGIDQ